MGVCYGQDQLRTFVGLSLTPYCIITLLLPHPLLDSSHRTHQHYKYCEHNLFLVDNSIYLAQVWTQCRYPPWCAACSGEIDIRGNHISSFDPGQPAGGSDNCSGGIHSNGGYHAISRIPVSAQPQASTQREGLILSSALQPIPSHLVRRICAGEFVEMRDLLSNNVALHDQVEAIQGPIFNAATPAALRPRIREVPSLISWVSCFLAYVAVGTNDDSTRDMITYCHLIVGEALRYGGQGWQEYDRTFRAPAAIDHFIHWNTLLPDLQAATILGKRTVGGSCCSLCRAVDHSPSQCALGPLQQPSMPPQPANSRFFKTNFTRRASQLRPRPICTSWNGGCCTYPGNCAFHHVCTTCGQRHQARGCKNTPLDSPFKRGRPGPGSSRWLEPVTVLVDGLNQWLCCFVKCLLLIAVSLLLLCCFAFCSTEPKIGSLERGRGMSVVLLGYREGNGMPINVYLGLDSDFELAFYHLQAWKNCLQRDGLSHW